MRQLAVLLVTCAGCQCGPGMSSDAGVDASVQAFDAGGPCEWVGPPCSGTTVYERLGCVPGLTVLKVSTNAPQYTAYALTLVQPVDHHDPAKGTFTQRASLLVRDPTRPTVLSTSGYNLDPSRSEPTRIFEANQLSYEHRYFAESRPLPTDWSYLTIEQAADDAHAWVKALRWVFVGPWLGTGISKGGMTSVYHRRFHACDVDATVAYVAPHSTSAADPVFPDFIATAGGPDWVDCRAKLTAFQRNLLSQRALVEPLIAGSYTQIGGVSKAFELAVTELPFAFWQYTSPDAVHGCGDIPTAPLTQTTAPDLLTFLNFHSAPFDLASDEALDFYAGYYYQAATQLGGPAPYEAPIRDVMQWPGLDVAASYAPLGVSATYSPEAMTDVAHWLDTEGERLMLIYGSFDPWGAAKIPLGHARDSMTFVVEGGSHAARIGQLDPVSKEAAVSTLESWLKTTRTITPMLLPAGAEDAPVRRYPR